MGDINHGIMSGLARTSVNTITEVEDTPHGGMREIE